MTRGEFRLGEFRFLDPGALVDGEFFLELIRQRPADRARGLVPSYDFAMRVARDPTQLAGLINFRAGSTYNLEMFGGHFGYGVEPAYRGNHYAARACRLLLPFVRRHDLLTLWITCNPDNHASRRTCECLGCSLETIVPLPPDNDQYKDGERFKCRYRLDLI
jgi:tagatose 1,6-diphosphate aldolase